MIIISSITEKQLQLAATLPSAICEQLQLLQPILISPLTFIHSNIQTYIKPNLIHSWHHTKCHFSGQIFIDLCEQSPKARDKRWTNVRESSTSCFAFLN